MQKKSQASVLDALKNFSHLPDDARVRRAVVRALFGWSNTTLHRRIADGTLPSPTRTSPGIPTWAVGEIRAKLKETADGNPDAISKEREMTNE